MLDSRAGRQHLCRPKHPQKLIFRFYDAFLETNVSGRYDLNTQAAVVVVACMTGLPYVDLQALDKSESHFATILGLKGKRRSQNGIPLL